MSYTLTLIDGGIRKQPTQVSQIIVDDVPVAWIDYDSCNRVLVFTKNKWHYVNGENITIRNVLEAIGHTKYVVTWVKRGEKYDIHDQLVINVPENTIRVFSNPEMYSKYDEYDESYL